MSEIPDVSAFVIALFDNTSDDRLCEVAMALVGTACAHLEAQLGARTASQILYGLADAMATQHIPREARRG